MRLLTRSSIRFLALVTILPTYGLASGDLLGQSQPVDFQREIQPILSEHCAQCHGVDEESRQAGLRIDLRESALKGGESGKPAIRPNHPESSELIERIRTSDPDQVMPPPSTEKPLSPSQQDLLARWISEGASYASHWAFEKPRRVPLENGGPSHPIDKIVQRKLRSLGGQPSPRASSSALCRRLYLDLIGLPPSIDELEAFEREGYEATVAKLLQSERYGEKWARHWLDAARYSDTNGYEKDLRRDQWAWRDWVVRALQQDLPYDQFLIQQLAGDLLPNANQDHWVATGFLRNSMLNEEGAIVPEQFRMFEMFDRMDCVGKAMLGLTTQCAQCHNHKFDPLLQEEYYGMFAFLNNAYESQSWVYDQEQERQRKRIVDGIDGIDRRIQEKKPKWREELKEWMKEKTDGLPSTTPLMFSQLESVSGLNHPVQLSDQSILMLGHTSSDVFFVSTPEWKNATGLQIEVLNHGDLPFRGPGRSQLGTWGILEVEAWVLEPDKKEWNKLKLVQASADFSEPDQKLDGNKKRGPVPYLIDGTDDTSWSADRGIGRRNQPSLAMVCFEKPLDFPKGTKLKIVMRMNSMVGCCRWSLIHSPEPTVPPIDYGALLAMKRSDAERTIEDERTIFAAWSKSQTGLSDLLTERDSLWDQYPVAHTSVLHLREREKGFQRETFRLERGEWDRPLRQVQPKTPTFLHRWDDAFGTDRLAFARWIASEDSPLTARVAVNRIWQSLFGQGLVETSEDFGTRTTVPEQLELLDWLAIDFMMHGWSQKQLIQTIVTSETYRQSSQASKELLEFDPRNRLLARGPRFRCDAEVVRDIALTVSGLIHHRLGGPSVIPPVPQNVLDYNYVYPSFWTPAQGPDRFRRTLYVFRKRSMPDPTLSNLDAPNGDTSCVRRVRSNTPLAALTGLNETIFVESAQGLALRILREGGDTDSQRIDHAYRLCVSRSPSSKERESLMAFLTEVRQRISEGWLNPREIATGEPSKIPDLPKHANPQDAGAWTLAARVLLNLDETISKN